MVQQNWHTETVLLYIACIVLANVFCFFSYKKKNDELGIYIGPYMASFTCCWALLALATCGADYPVYKNMFLQSYNINIVLKGYGIEPGFALFNYIIRIFTDNVNVYFGIFSFLFVFFIYKGIYNYKNIIPPRWSVFIFTTVLFLQQINLKRIYLVAAIIFWGTQFLVDKKYMKYLAVIIVCTSIHYSSILMLFALLYDIMINKRISKRGFFVISIIGIVFIYTFRNTIFSFILSQRYTNYGVQQGRIGILQIAYHVPILISLSKGKVDSYNQRHRDVAFIYAMFSLIIGMTGYFVVMIGRAFVYFYYALAMAPALSCKRNESEKPSRWFILDSKKFWGITYVVYFCIRLILYMNTYLFFDQIMPYQDIFQNIF